MAGRDSREGWSSSSATSSLETLEGTYAEARDGRGALVFVGGEAGVGKTSARARFCDDLPATAPVLVGRVRPARHPAPARPVPRHRRQPGRAARRALEAARRRTRSPRRSSASSRGRRSSSCSRTSTGRTRRRSTCCALLGRRIGRAPTLVLVTYRDDELDRAHPLRVVLGELATADGVERARRVEPLSPDGGRASSPPGTTSTRPSSTG